MRAFYLLTLSMMLRCELMGLYVTEAPAKQQAMKALDEADTYVTRDDLIRRLRIAAHASVGVDQQAPEAGPPPNEPTEAVKALAAEAAVTLRRITDPIDDAGGY